MNKLIYLDTETTGLDPELHDIWEIAWAIEDGPIRSEVVVHSLKTASPKALELNGYFDRFPTGARSAGPLLDLEIRSAVDGATILCANPCFDRMFLRKRWGVEPWHYRSVDIESYAMAIFGWTRPRGLKDIRNELAQLGYTIPEPNHTAAGDVDVLRQCHLELMNLRAQLHKGDNWGAVS